MEAVGQRTSTLLWLWPRVSEPVNRGRVSSAAFTTPPCWPPGAAASADQTSEPSSSGRAR